jgi:hypothetical protein
MPPHDKIPPHALPIKNKNKAKFLGISIVISSTVTFLVGIALSLLNIPLTTIIPSSAPILMGTTTMSYMMQIER